MKKIHYTEGYGGNFNYSTFCGKEIHSHSKTEGADINPTEVTCKKCMASKEFIEDLKNCLGVGDAGIKRRIFIESDILRVDEIQSAQNAVEYLCESKGVKFVRRVFSEILDKAWHDLEKTWAAVKAADEIYADSSLLPLCGGSYMGAPVIFNGMCERAIKEGVKGKDVYILNELKNINWHMIDLALMRKAFKNNNLFMYNEDREMVKVDVSKIKK